MALYVSCVGNSTEIGKCHGQAAQKQIVSSIENYRSLFAKMTPPLEWSKAREIGRNYLPTIKQHIPSAIEEITAIANAANVPFDDILVLNCRSEIGLTGGIVDGGTAIAYKDPETGKQLLAQNWDWHSNQLNNVIVLDIIHLNGTRVITITEAGMVGKVGFNGDCVGVTLNPIKTEGISLDYSMLPITFALRFIVMESPNAGEAINQILRIGVAGTAQFLIADAISAYSVASSALGGRVIPPDSDGFVLPINYGISSADNSKATIWPPDAIRRMRRWETLKPTIHSSDDIWEVLADEKESLGSIRHGGVENGSNDGLETLFGIVIDLEFGMAEMVHGRPIKGKQRTMLPKTGPLGNMSNDVRRQSEWM